MEQRDEEIPLPFPWALLGVTLAAVCLQAAAGFAIYRMLDTWPERGTFGDMFGFVNCLFSGLAFAGVIYTIGIQREELRLQRQELALTRRELQRAAAAQEKQMTMQSIREILTEMDHREAHLAREYVYKNFRTYQRVAGDPALLPTVPPEAYEKAAAVSNAFDRVGVFVHEGLVPRDVVIKNFGSSIARSWIALAPFINALRRERYNEKYEVFFENLANDAVQQIGEDGVMAMLSKWSLADGTSTKPVEGGER